MSRWPTPIKWRAIAHESADGTAKVALSEDGRRWLVDVRDMPKASCVREAAAIRLAERLMRRRLPAKGAGR